MKKHFLLATSLFLASCSTTAINSYTVDGKDFVSISKEKSLEKIASRLHNNLQQSIGIQAVYTNTATTKQYFEDYISEHSCSSEYLCEIEFTYRGGEITRSMGKKYSEQVFDIILETSPDGKLVTVTYPSTVTTISRRNLIGMKLHLALSDLEVRRILNRIRQTSLN